MRAIQLNIIVLRPVRYRLGMYPVGDKDAGIQGILVIKRRASVGCRRNRVEVIRSRDVVDT